MDAEAAHTATSADHMVACFLQAQLHCVQQRVQERQRCVAMLLVPATAWQVCRLQLQAVAAWCM